MSGKVILNLAISLDGYIADENGGYDWIIGHGNHRLDTENQYPFSDFKDSIDIVVMGHTCYLQGFASDYTKKKVYVASNSMQEDTENIEFIRGDIIDIIIKERDDGKTIYLFGGGILIDPFIKANIVDEYMISIIPTILGKGIPLFLGNNPTIALLLNKYSIEDGIIHLFYSKK